MFVVFINILVSFCVEILSYTTEFGIILVLFICYYSAY